MNLTGKHICQHRALVGSEEYTRSFPSGLEFMLLNQGVLRQLQPERQKPRIILFSSVAKWRGPHRDLNIGWKILE
jgi:hypothetical protein